MSLNASTLFSTDPGKIQTFGGVRTADIFNQTVVERNNALDQMARQAFADLDEFSESRRALSQQREQEDVLAVERVNELLPSGRPPSASPFEETEDFDYNTPMDSEIPSAPTVRVKSTDPASILFENEARRDSSGKLRVYQPPKGDGGGAFEVAGITARYQPREAARLRKLIEEGRHDEAEAEAKAFYAKRAAPFVKHTERKGLQLQLTDTVHHRGEGGLRSILRRATGTSEMTTPEMIRMLDADPDALRKFDAARRDYEAKVVDRGRSERAKFRKGLDNRFQRVYDLSIQMND